MNGPIADLRNALGLRNALAAREALSTRDAQRPRTAPPGRATRLVALVTPVLDDWGCFAALLSDISVQYTGAGVEFHVVAVDDGSAEPFDPAALSLPADSCIVAVEVLRLAVNLGHQRAIAVGLCALAERPDLDAVIVLDSDGEDRPSDIAALFAAYNQQPGAVILARRSKRSETLAFRLWYRLYKAVFLALTGKPISFGNFSLLPMPAVRRLVHMPELWNNLAASIIRSRVRYATVPTERGTRYGASSRMNLVSLIVHGLSALSVHTDTIFVRVLLGAGLVALASMIGIIAVAVIRFTTDLAIPGWATTAVGDLSIVLMQTFVIITAACLTMLAGRSTRPIVPIADAAQFVAERHRYPAPPVAASAAVASLAAATP